MMWLPGLGVGLASSVWGIRELSILWRREFFLYVTVSRRAVSYTHLDVYKRQDDTSSAKKKELKVVYEVIYELLSLRCLLYTSDVTEDEVSSHLYTGVLHNDIPDPDLIIRTSGEERLSNFLIWQSAYSEMMFTDTLWPDYSPEEFAEMIGEFSHRKRRFGGREKEDR